ncbi:uncharacterized protein DFL_001347 [Arthrobotrys flagrans]|uniref:Prion-inhibition and propagation HeLo domain-containing protein n=1 Tax=Arthrobotrys flagrans TaxID=97331 RepID=A0A437AGX7_ARTFL|nr:hypothetical protein DFL_001347 [Arthrobotrys flagrans]
MGRVYHWTEVEICPKREQLKEGMRRLITAIQMFRTALVSTRAYFTQTVYPTPVEGLQAHHQLVFQTSVALHTQNRIISQAAKLIRNVRRTHFDKEAQKWDDEDLKTLSVDLLEQVTDCNKENQEMLDEMGTKFSVQIHYYEANENEQVGVNRNTIDNIWGNGMQERRIDSLTTEYRF